jgi:signal transduction histidine kinase
MLDLNDLQRLVGALCSDDLAPQAGQLGWSLQRLVARAGALGDAARAELGCAASELQPTVLALLASATGSTHLEARVLRDVTTLCRRLSTTLDHVGAHPGAERLPADRLRVSYARVDLAAALARAGACFDDLAASRRIAFEVSVPDELMVEVDLGKVELAIGNALFNAFKYAPEGGVVRCVVSLDELLDDVVVSIEDNGPSVPTTQLDAIFDRAREADRSVAIRIDSVRLSLGLSRDVVALHGGTLDTVPTGNGHALFEVRLPRRAPRGAQVSEHAPAPASWLSDVAELAAAELRAEAELGGRPVATDGRPLVLVIEDSRALNRVVVGCLEPTYATASAFDGATGIELALALRPDLVIVDLALPKIDGEVVIRTLRGQEGFECCILAMTGSRNDPQILRLLDAGVEDYLAKPFLLAELRARATRLLATKKTQDVLSDTIGQRDTDLIALANEVAETHHNLERAYVDLEAARERAERMSEMKSNFLRIMSHELKTPVTAMRLQLSVLANDPGVEHTPVLDRGLERIARSTSRLLHLVDTTLEWARVEDGRCRPEVEPFDLVELVEDVVAELEIHARVRQLELHVEAPQPRPALLHSDRRIVRLVLINLVEHAIWVSDDARLAVRVVESERGLQVHVHDAAPVMSPEQRAEVFDPLKQTRDFHRRSGAGSGLGVYAVRDIARAVGGEIRWQDGGGTGNVFVFDVPALQAGPEAERADVERRPERRMGRGMAG